MADSVPMDLKSLFDTAKQSGDILVGILVDAGVPHFLAVPVGNFVGGVVMLGGLFYMGVVGCVAQVFVPVSIALLQALDGIRQNGAPEFAKVSINILQEFLGVDFGSVDLSTGKGADANMERARQIGTLFQNRLSEEFGGNGDGGEGPGERAAKTFSGYLINFASANAMLSMIAELISDDHLTQVRELGVEVAQNLGLGRLHRSAMKPLIDATIAKPYTRELAKRYRPDRLTAQQYITAYVAGRITLEQCKDELAQQGYSDDLVDVLIAQLSGKQDKGDLAELVRAGIITAEDKKALLTLDGIPAGVAGFNAQADVVRNEMPIKQHYVTEAYNLAKVSDLTVAEFQAVLDEVGLPDGEKQLWLKRLSLQLQFVNVEHLRPPKHISIGQLAYLGERNQITDTDVDRWVEAEGYTSEDAGLIHLFVLGKELDFENAQKLKADKAAAAAAKAKAKTPGKPPA